ncbi:hypothetical protein KKH82_08320 [Patescibacteria group bacterium]|nr:hypothetical protein [Patescibacteria group bacterium]
MDLDSIRREAINKIKMKKIIGFIIWLLVFSAFIWLDYFCIKSYISATKTNISQTVEIDLSSFEGEILNSKDVVFSSVLNKGSKNLDWMIDNSSSTSTLAFTKLYDRTIHFEFYHPRDGMCNVYYKYSIDYPILFDDSGDSFWYDIDDDTVILKNNVLTAYLSSEMRFISLIIFLIVVELLVLFLWHSSYDYNEIEKQWWKVIKKIFLKKV